jgi:predicted DNA binding CopG/RHH family protein
MKRKVKLPRFKSDREAADSWATHDAAPYVHAMKEVRLKLDPALRRRIKARAAQKKPVTLRLEMGQISAAKVLAQRKSMPYQTLLRMWIAERLAREGVS